MPSRLLPLRFSKRNLSFWIVFSILFTCICYFSIPSYTFETFDLSLSPRPDIYRLNPGREIPSTLVIAATAQDDVGWTISQFANETASGLLKTAVYIVDDASAHYSVPMNKGHEVMVYLTYIIDHYDSLSDVTIFMHSHQITWHNNDLLLSDAVSTIKRLRRERVLRHGYMNLRCHLDPGCPSHINLDVEEYNANIPEAIIMKDTWKTLFPNATVPKVLSQPCCGQFAVSLDRLQHVPREQYISWRQWLIETDLDDGLSGRVWEYFWQWIFAGVEEFCPEQHVCYCDGYGVCLGGKSQFDAYFKLREDTRNLRTKVTGIRPDGTSVEKPTTMTEEEKANAWTIINSNMETLNRIPEVALERGMDASQRAKELGRHHST